ncbi:hypothetical protein CL630_00105 [bacterium]|nr:hypothetical protein [bacterium]|tara:strand:- start:8484 stop:9095 length:612 start_codon:yes stop_codon:yes gene_type:complete
MATICIFGDSITWGAVDPQGGGWATRLRNFFESQELRVDQDIDVYNLGVSGDNSDDLIKRFNMEMNARKPDVVLFAIGINDSQFIISKNQNRVSLEKFKSNLEKMIQDAKGTSANVILIGLTCVDESKTSPVPWNTDKRYSNIDIEKYDAAIQAIAEKENHSYIDMSGVLSTNDLEDGLHPNTEGHTKLFEVVKKQLIYMLRQ